MKIEQKPIKIGAHNVNEITMENSSGISVSFLTYGAVITKFMVPDKNGNFENIVLSLADYNDYADNTSLIGSTIGRTSGKIYDAHLLLNNKDIFLTKNYGIHHIHGGKENFAKKVFDYDISIESDKIYVDINYISKDMEEGYPGQCKIDIRYTLDEENNFKIEYSGVSDEDTLLNLSNHTYFNLSGNNKTDILSHNICIPSEYYYAIDEEKNITGELLPTTNTPFDFSKLKEIGKDISSDDSQIRLGNGYDHCFLLNDKDNFPTVTLYDGESMRSLNITTNQKSLCMYTQNYYNNETLNYSSSLNTHRGINLQFQSPPIGYNSCNLEYSILKKDEKYSKFVNYHFRLI